MQRSQIFVQNRVFCLPRLHSTLPLGGFPSEYRHPVWRGKTRMACFRRYLYSFWHKWQFTNVTDGRTHTHRERQTLHADISRAYASHRAAKIKDMFTCFDRIHDRRTDRHTLRLCIASWNKTKQIIFDPLNSINLRPLLTLPGTSELVTFK